MIYLNTKIEWHVYFSFTIFQGNTQKVKTSIESLRIFDETLTTPINWVEQ